jgi:hypothetical protein
MLKIYLEVNVGVGDLPQSCGPSPSALVGTIFLMGNCLRYKLTTNSFHAFQKDAVSSPGA